MGARGGKEPRAQRRAAAARTATPDPTAGEGADAPGLSTAASPRRYRGLLRGADGFPCWALGRIRWPLRAAMSIATVRANRHCRAIAAAAAWLRARRMRGPAAALSAAQAQPRGVEVVASAP